MVECLPSTLKALGLITSTENSLEFRRYSTIFISLIHIFSESAIENEGYVINEIYLFPLLKVITSFWNIEQRKELMLAKFILEVFLLIVLICTFFIAVLSQYPYLFCFYILQVSRLSITKHLIYFTFYSIRKDNHYQVHF